MVDRGADRNRISIRITVTSFSHIVYWCVGKFLRELPICVVCGVLGVVAMRRGRGVQTVTGLLSQVSLMTSFGIAAVWWFANGTLIHKHTFSGYDYILLILPEPPCLILLHFGERRKSR